MLCFADSFVQIYISTKKTNYWLLQHKDINVLIICQLSQYIKEIE